jgi:hypothetical protein
MSAEEPAPVDSQRAPLGRRWSAMAYRDQSAEDLRLNLIDGEVDLAQFRTHERACLACDWIAIDARIIGASHAMRMELSDGTRFHEILACGPVSAPAPALYSDRVLSRSGPIELELGEGIGYRFEAEDVSATVGAARLSDLSTRVREAEGARPAARAWGLRFDFPSSPARVDDAGAEPACTLAWLRISEDMARIEVETAHSYPNEARIVFSSTRLSRPLG